MEGEGVDDRYPLIPHTDGDDDDDDEEWVFTDNVDDTPPGPSGEQMEMTTMNRPPEQQGPYTAETSVCRGCL